jgi:hypothetical protein
MLAPAAHAGAVTYSFGLTGVDSGSLAITETSGLISNITGTFDGLTISSILPTGGGSIGVPDDEFFTTPPYLDGSGVSFALTAADPDGYGFVNLSWNSVLSAYYAEQSVTSANTGGVAFGPDSLTLLSASAPEPGSVILVMIGLAAGLVMRSRMVQGSSSAR